MPRRLLCVLPLVLSCLTCCSRRPLPGTPQQRLERFFDTRNQVFGNSRAEIIENLGKPKLERTDDDLSQENELTAEDRRLLLGHASEPINQITELVYDGLSLKILKVNSPPYSEFVYDLTVTSAKRKMSWDLNIGSPRQKVRRILGNPSRSDDLTDSYDVVHSGDPTGYTNLVVFTYHDSRVDRIRFWLYID